MFSSTTAGTRIHRLASLALALLLLPGCAGNDRQAATASQTFTLAVIPDTQNYLDYKHQQAEGFALDVLDPYTESPTGKEGSDPSTHNPCPENGYSPGKAPPGFLSSASPWPARGPCRSRSEA